MNINFIDPDDNPYPSLEDLATIDFGAAGIREILQDVYRLVLTSIYSVPLDRLMGFRSQVVDAPINTAEDRIVAEVLEVIHYYENRVDIIDVTFAADALNGRLIPTIKLRIRNVIYGTTIPYPSQPAYFY